MMSPIFARVAREKQGVWKSFILLFLVNVIFYGTGTLVLKGFRPLSEF